MYIIVRINVILISIFMFASKIDFSGLLHASGVVTGIPRHGLSPQQGELNSVWGHAPLGKFHNLKA